MMHLVTYMVSTPRDISRLIEELQRCVSWWHYIDNTWIVVTGENTGELVSRLKPFVLDGDLLLIVEITKESDIPAGFLPRDAWDWINSWKKGNGARPTAMSLPPPQLPPFSPF